MAYSLADHVRLAREAWERGHSVVVAAVAELAQSRGVAVQNDGPYPHGGSQLRMAYADFIRHMRPLEPYMSGMPLVDNLIPWRFGPAQVDANSQDNGRMCVPLTVAVVETLTADSWKTIESQTNEYANEWRQFFQSLAQKLSPLSEMEANVLEAIADKTLTGPEIAKAAGYAYSSSLRSSLSQMVEKGLLEKARKGSGYLKPKMSGDNP